MASVSRRLQLFLGILVIAGVCTCWASRPGATPIDITYVATPCNGAFAACTITPTVRTPTPDQLVGLDSAAFLAYFLAQGIHSARGPFTFFITDSSPDYVIGHVFGNDVIMTEFVYGADGLICCITDTPFTVNDINDNNFVVGLAYSRGPFLDTVAPARAYSTRPDILNPQVFVNDPVLYYTTFLAIDDTNSILARSLGQYYELHPVPEPPTLALFCGGLVAAFWFLKRRGGSGGTAHFGATAPYTGLAGPITGRFSLAKVKPARAPYGGLGPSGLRCGQGRGPFACPWRAALHERGAILLGEAGPFARWHGCV